MNKSYCPWSPNATCRTELFSDLKSAFIIGSNDPSRREYIETIKEVLREFDLEPNFALDLSQYNGKNAFCTNICGQIRKSRIIITDLSGPWVICNDCKSESIQQSINVYWEYGYAAALEKDPILLCDENQPVPFDIADKNTEFYNKKSLTKILKTLIKHKIDTPIPKQRFKVLTRVVPEDYQLVIDSFKNELYERIKKKDLKLIFSFFPYDVNEDLFPLDDHMKFFLERRLPLRTKRDYSVFRDFTGFEISQNYFASFSKNIWMGNNLLVASDGIIIYGIYINGEEHLKQGYNYKNFPVKEILACLLGFLDYVHDIYEYVKFEDFLIISMEIQNISNYYLFQQNEYWPNMIQKAAEFAKFKQKNFKKVVKSYSIQELKNSNQKLKIARNLFDPVLRAFDRINIPIYDQF
ncbi:hypothetical protein LCGC14_0931310 [marine sediment metagenome]|uniref:Uncharacterized protein n=1 Tax=marine sediment metagenome TaxID=412755 RepID=A0A0F9R6D5_9ZZZZ|nr:hypothetical protein [bacterium]